MGDATVSRGARAWPLVPMLVFALVAAPVAAQDWASNSYDDGSFFSGALGPVDGPGFTLVCGERSPQGLSPAQTGNTEPEITRRNAFRLYLDQADIGPPSPNFDSRQDVLAVIGTTGYRLPLVRWNELYSTWETDIPANDPMLAAISGQAAFELRSDTGSHLVSARGFAEGLGQLTSYCLSMFASIGQPWAGTVTGTATGPAPGAMRQAAQAHVQAGCRIGVLEQHADAILTGDIDGDGAEDVVLDWRGVRCAGSMAQPFCGASNCSVDIFLSSQYPRSGQPEGWLALGARLIPLTNGNMGVGMYGSLSACNSAFGRVDCEFQYYWNGSSLTRLN